MYRSLRLFSRQSFGMKLFKSNIQYKSCSSLNEQYVSPISISFTPYTYQHKSQLKNQFKIMGISKRFYTTQLPHYKQSEQSQSSRSLQQSQQSLQQSQQSQIQQLQQQIQQLQQQLQSQQQKIQKSKQSQQYQQEVEKQYFLQKSFSMKGGWIEAFAAFLAFMIVLDALFGW